MPNLLFEPWVGKCFSDKAQRRREGKGERTGAGGTERVSREKERKKGGKGKK